MTEISPELVERMVALMRRINVDMFAHLNGTEGGISPSEIRDEARAIVAELPAPVDPDLLLAREVTAALEEVAGNSSVASCLRRGMADDVFGVRVALAAIKSVHAEGGK